MNNILMILEVSRKQDYIFSSKKLRENAAHSNHISYVTGSEFFKKTAGDLYDESENFVYAGGGHTILQFDSQPHAFQFAQTVTEAVYRQFDGLELFVKQLPYQPEKTPGENLKELAAALERKKARRSASFGQVSFGLEKLDLTFSPAAKKKAETDDIPSAGIAAPQGWTFTNDIEKIAGGDSFIAVVHIDGNAMGKRVEEIYQKSVGNWEDCRQSLRRFSETIQADFTRAFQEMTLDIIRWQPEGCEAPILPIRPIILAGDDVCFVTRGTIGLECARLFLQRLTALTNQEDGKPYAACAGVAMIHKKFPFHTAYRLSEELCSNAKRFGAELNSEGRISAMDWHIEFGQMKDSLSRIRDDYRTEDGGRLELRPVTVVVPEDCETARQNIRSYEFFRSLCGIIQRERGKTARAKIKELRAAFKQGELESQFFMQDKQIHRLLYHPFEAEHREKTIEVAYELLTGGQKQLKKDIFQEIDGVRRNLFFDAIEMSDHSVFWKGEENESYNA